MRKHLLLFFVMFASVLSLSAQDDASVENAVITIKTNKAVDTELTIEGYASIQRMPSPSIGVTARRRPIFLQTYGTPTSQPKER